MQHCAKHEGLLTIFAAKITCDFARSIDATLRTILLVTVLLDNNNQTFSQYFPQHHTRSAVVSHYTQYLNNVTFQQHCQLRSPDIT